MVEIPRKLDAKFNELDLKTVESLIEGFKKKLKSLKDAVVFLDLKNLDLRINPTQLTQNTIFLTELFKI